MIELNGKYNTAKIFTNNVDAETQSQIIQLLNQPFMSENKIRIMPDCHAGAGCVIGTTMTLTDKVIPNLVGVDIGCGMYALELKEANIDLNELDNVINNYVPCGFSIHDHAIAKSNINDIIAPIDIEKAFKSLGTLGGGNHFIEIDKASNGKLWLVIHTGSRHLGIEICKYYQNLGYENISQHNIAGQIAKIIIELKHTGKEKEIENAIHKLHEQVPSIPKDLCYVENQIFDNYMHDMKLAQEHASINRETIANTIINKMHLHAIQSFQTIHNYIDIDNMILRKGAVSAKANEKLIIPMNMRDGSLICIGKGNPDWNYSAPHGAGRIMSRSQAKEQISMNEFTDTMKNIYSTSVMESTIDEAPMVYKPMKEIMNNIIDTVDIIDIIKPIYNFKAH